MSAHVLLNLLDEFKKRDKMQGLLSILSIFHNKFNKYNNTGACILDSIYSRTLVARTRLSRTPGIARTRSSVPAISLYI